MIMYVKVAQFHGTITRSAILCGSECWVTYIQQIHKMIVAEMGMLRWRYCHIRLELIKMTTFS